MDQPILFGLIATAAGVNQRELADSAEAAIGPAEQGDDDLLAFAPLVQPVGAGIPDPNLAAAVLALGDLALEAPVLQRMIFGLYRQVVDLGISRGCLGHRPADQHAVPLQPA